MLSPNAKHGTVTSKFWTHWTLLKSLFAAAWRKLIQLENRSGANDVAKS